MLQNHFMLYPINTTRELIVLATVILMLIVNSDRAIFNVKVLFEKVKYSFCQVQNYGKKMFYNIVPVKGEP